MTDSTKIFLVNSLSVILATITVCGLVIFTIKLKQSGSNKKLLTKEQKELVLSYYILGYYDGKGDTYNQVFHNQEPNFGNRIKIITNHLDSLSITKK